MMNCKKMLAGLLLGTSVLLAGCSADRTADIAGDIALGTKEEAVGGAELLNETGLDFVSVRMKLLSEKEFGSNLVDADSGFASGKSAALFIPAASAQDGDKKEEDEPVSLLFATEDTQWQFDDFDWADVKGQAVLQLSDQVLELHYTSKKDEPVVLKATAEQAAEPESTPETQKEEGQAEGETSSDPNVQEENGSGDESSHTEEGGSSDSGSSSSGSTGSSSDKKKDPGKKDPKPDQKTEESDEQQEELLEVPVFDPPVDQRPEGTSAD